MDSKSFSGLIDHILTSTLHEGVDRAEAVLLRWQPRPHRPDYCPPQTLHNQGKNALKQSLMLCLALQGLTGLKRYWCGQSLGSHGQIVFTDDPYVIQVIFYNALGFFLLKHLF